MWIMLKIYPKFQKMSLNLHTLLICLKLTYLDKIQDKDCPRDIVLTIIRITGN